MVNTGILVHSFDSEKGKGGAESVLMRWFRGEAFKGWTCRSLEGDDVLFKEGQELPRKMSVAPAVSVYSLYTTLIRKLPCY